MGIVLGDMYHKYKYFKIVLNSYCGWTSGAVTYSINTVYMNMTGLDFVNTTFNGQLSNIAKFPNQFNLPSNGSSGVNFSNDDSGIVFRRPDSPIVNLKITFLNPRNIISTASTVISPSLNFNFTIYGLYEEDEK